MAEKQTAPLEKPAATPSISLRALRKSFDRTEAVRGVDLDIADGEFFSLLGPSGSGKTTVLRMIAGFELPTAGQILLAGRDVSQTAPFDRDVNTVFQDYALFPHMTVLANIEYGLKVKGVRRPERRRRALQALESVRLPDVGGRKPAQLSGGQRQRIALARALVNRPKVLLLDEPLGALDLKLRQEMQIELKKIQREVGITFVFVTHDQEEALTMSDRIAVLADGRIEQVGTPVEVYEHPATDFVAGFVGTANLTTGQESVAVHGFDGTVSLRPERIRIEDTTTAAADDERRADGIVSDIAYVGSQIRFSVELDAGVTMTVLVPNTAIRRPPAAAERVRLVWKSAHALRVGVTQAAEKESVSTEGES
ncbi:ABC transporter ATP-binding protein [Fodinicola acaciae]|uniref:ABC transporter ATP-binding protein n=1 Tax=Fodinicola acaciae TaxID=2681555 RepID=UPI0013CFDC83|nr:ABC transporter ATP-binding protein [Fodinicola acaciae]